LCARKHECRAILAEKPLETAGFGTFGQRALFPARISRSDSNKKIDIRLEIISDQEQTRFGCHWLCQCDLTQIVDRSSTGEASGTRTSFPQQTLTELSNSPRR
jgi:hypothetical protein